MTERASAKEDIGEFDTCARHLISSVGELITQDASPPTAPAMNVVYRFVAGPGESGLYPGLRKAVVRLYVMKRSALRAPYPRIGAVAPRIKEEVLLNCDAYVEGCVAVMAA